MIVVKLSDEIQNRLGVKTADEAQSLIERGERPEAYRERRALERRHQETESALRAQISKLETENTNLRHQITAFESKPKPSRPNRWPKSRL